MAPPITQSQNGIDGRDVRPLKTDVRNISSTELHPKVDQHVATLASIAKNNAPNTIERIAPSLSTLGDVVCYHGLHTPRPTAIMAQINSVRDITNSRNAIIREDANRAVKAILARMSKGGCRIFFPLDSAVQIAHKRRRVGTFHADAHMISKLVLGKA